jgi:hypothetical protein
MAAGTGAAGGRGDEGGWERRDGCDHCSGGATGWARDQVGVVRCSGDAHISELGNWMDVGAPADERRDPEREGGLPRYPS